MLGLNNVQIIGNLGGAPEMKYVNNDDHVVNFPVAVNERWKNRNGDALERTTWLRIVAFNGLGSVCAEFLKRGDPVYVEGRLQSRTYDDKDGKKQYVTEVVAQSQDVILIGGGGASGGQDPGPRDDDFGQPVSMPRSAQRPRQQPQPERAFDQGIGDDDIPF